MPAEYKAQVTPVIEVRGDYKWTWRKEKQPYQNTSYTLPPCLFSHRISSFNQPPPGHLIRVIRRSTISPQPSSQRYTYPEPPKSCPFSMSRSDPPSPRPCPRPYPVAPPPSPVKKESRSSSFMSSGSPPHMKPLFLGESLAKHSERSPQYIHQRMLTSGRRF